MGKRPAFSYLAALIRRMWGDTYGVVRSQGMALGLVLAVLTIALLYLRSSESERAAVRLGDGVWATLSAAGMVFLGMVVWNFLAAPFRIAKSQEEAISSLREIVDRKPVSNFGRPRWEVECERLDEDWIAFDLCGVGDDALPGMIVRCDIENPAGVTHFVTKENPSGKLLRFNYPRDFAGATQAEDGRYEIRFTVTLPVSPDHPFIAAQGAFDITRKPYQSRRPAW